VLPIISFLPCPSALSDNNACVEDNGSFYFERPNTYFSQIGSDGTLLFFVLLGIFTIAAFNVFGVTVTKKVSSLARSVVDVTRTLLVWIIGLIFSWTSLKGRENWENSAWGAIGVEFVGFIILVGGNLIYNEIIKLPFGKEDTEPKGEEE